ncbi:MAG: type II CRISPR-associated endonuclease Cas1 [Planctomycetes bacterium]|nr:type II CRISPR-associated endonuclease Cas1 [Planctomycetota bacterium]
MIKRTIEISEAPAHLSVKDGQLRIARRGEDRAETPTIPCEDIALLMVDEHSTTYSHAALAILLKHGAVVVICGRDHLPAGMLLPLADHTQVVQRLHQQIAVSKPLCKQLWKQIVQAKIQAQAQNLPREAPQYRRLLALAREVRSGDPKNVEAQAAKVYWSAWLGDEKFKRDPDGASPNHFLNYGYAVLRATVARALVGCGFQPALGLHHSNRSNPFCLADDLLEPLRPLVDDVARTLHFAEHHSLDRDSRAELLKLLAATVYLEGERSPLMVAVQRMVGSLVGCFEGTSRRLLIPSAGERGP